MWGGSSPPPPRGGGPPPPPRAGGAQRRRGAQGRRGARHPAARVGGRRRGGPVFRGRDRDRKSTRLNSSHSQISYAVFCLKKKKNTYWSRPHQSADLLLDQLLIPQY